MRVVDLIEMLAKDTACDIPGYYDFIYNDANFECQRIPLASFWHHITLSTVTQVDCFLELGA